MDGEYALAIMLAAFVVALFIGVTAWLVQRGD